MFFLDKKAIWFIHFYEKVFNNNNVWFYVHISIKETYLADMQRISLNLSSLTYRKPRSSLSLHSLLELPFDNEEPQPALIKWIFVSQRAHLWLQQQNLHHKKFKLLYGWCDFLKGLTWYVHISLLVWIKNELLKWTSQNSWLPNHRAVSELQCQTPFRWN